MKAVIILCCIALSTATNWGYSFGSGGFPYGPGPLNVLGGGIRGFNQGGATVVAGPTSIGFGRGHAVSTPTGTFSTAIGKGIGTAPHNAGQIVKVGPITSFTSPLGSNHPTNGFFNGQGPYNLDGIYYGGQGFGLGSGYVGYGSAFDRHGLGGGYGLGGGFGFGGGYGPGGAFGGYSSGFGRFGPWGGHGLGASRDVVGAGTSAAISARGNAQANAVGARVSGQPIEVSSSGTGRPVWTPSGPIGVADSGSSSVTTGFGPIPYDGFNSGYSGLLGFGGLPGGVAGYYPSNKKF